MDVLPAACRPGALRSFHPDMENPGMAYRDPARGRAADRERFRKRRAARLAAGLCPRCGKTGPAPGRSLCEPCTDRRNRASRARDARLKAEGRPRRDPEKARDYRRKRSRRVTAERLADGICTRCGKAPAAPDRTSCEPCLEARRAADRAKYRAGKETGALYGGADVEMKRRIARIASRKREKARRAAGSCIRCGKRPPVDGGTTCAPCRDKRQQAERQRYCDRRAARLCTRCGGPTTDGGARCAPCSAIEAESRSAERKNAAARRRYRSRRSRSECTDCGAASHGAARCDPCARRSYERSDHVRGMPLYAPSFTVIEIETGACHGTFDCEADVVLCLAFAGLSRDQVEIVVDEPVLARLAGWE